MVEGWQNEVYLTIFDDSQIASLMSAYGFSEFLPNYRLIGLHSWDEFIVADANNATFTVPTVPLIGKHLEPYTLQQSLVLQSDEHLAGRIKWYIKPVVFGGDPQFGDNITWISVAKHAELVRWWNTRYREVAADA